MHVFHGTPFNTFPSLFNPLGIVQRKTSDRGPKDVERTCRRPVDVHRVRLRRTQGAYLIFHAG